MASGAPIDPLQTLATALTLPSDSKDQAEILAGLREHLEAQPNAIPVLCVTLLQNIITTEDTPFKRWILDLYNFAISRSSLPIETRTELASQCLNVNIALLADSSAAIVKIAIQCFASSYALLFRSLCTNRNNRQQWDLISHAKRRILDLVDSTAAPIGVRLSALKFLQRVILVQTRGVTDPRLQNKADPNISMCPTDHPFISASALEGEGSQLLTQIITMLYTNSNPDILTAILHSFGPLAKVRPNLVQIIAPTLTSWTPASLSGQSASAVKSVEKVVRVLLGHISRTGTGIQYIRDITEALSQQQTRMDAAAREENAHRIAEASRKRALVGGEEPSDTKRAKTEPPPSTATPAPPVAGPSSAPPTQPESQSYQPGMLAEFDFTALSVSLVTDLIMANLLAVSEERLNSSIELYRSAKVIQNGTAAAEAEKAVVKEEILDPLKMDIDEEELEFEPEKLNQQLLDGTAQALDADSDDVMLDGDNAMGQLRLQEFRSSAPPQLTDEERFSLIKLATRRISLIGEEMNPSPADLGEEEEGSPEASVRGTEMWMLVLIRLVTRGLPEEEELVEAKGEIEESMSTVVVDIKGKGKEVASPKSGSIRQVLCDYVMADFSSRVRFATIWMNEEWYNDGIRSAKDPTWRRNYDDWLHRLLTAHLAYLDPKDKTFSGFLLDLPNIPSSILDMLQNLCIDQERMQTGFVTLRNIVSMRPPLRGAALKILLDLTTHPEKVTRGAAIITVKRWIPDVKPMDEVIRAFALRMLHRLTTAEESLRADGMDEEGEKKNGVSDGGDTSSTAVTEDFIGTPYLPGKLELPVERAVVLQHVELLFALCVKVPEFLDEIFLTYGQMSSLVQEAIQDLITPMIRSLGSNHGKLLTILRTFPPGADSLALRSLAILTEKNRPSAPLVSLVKGLISERELDARFLIPIIAEMDKPDILRYLPRIVGMLNGGQEEKALVRSVFAAIVTTPPQSLGSVSSNLPRVRQSELLTPAELMVLLHRSDKEIENKSAIEAIGICFSMTDVFRSDILAVVMQQILDQSELPLLFLRTVIQAVTTYKSLIPFVSTTLLSRLITKKIWTNPRLWTGFIHCAKAIAPASFGALLQLPKEQLREIVDKQPGLRSGLREHVIKKAGNKARPFLEVLGEDGSQTPEQAAASPAVG